ncbi:class I SAM-dependent RNA methyltransferase [Candidatus Falkowbacteria bacterium]|jgi:23S rRNA (uracil1939-C5)-methyltransferase|nr:class I SAM-dependent RNA methyltransferase [Candidatus Falkowbacteria bacterium]MBT5503523.1 class I SAM-dependent RNA methyltransferase [Candidatus Falkowbacteria bacterium]MBT6574410.1 class I SAM-dependent RNA methyltransferase [Candidatus Falkowbacteria bacterium]MBT7348927.1 class I SAM-dependent RNA methyltransferase [Candidatus Falkowbacteria bacterium]MBT7501283.1 class I SAM-dependent RNA methyltransferase [Candidatus Falkowbacteria bacterium]
MLKIKIEKLIAGGQGLARHDGCVYFVWNVLPGEEVEVEVLKKKKNYAEAVVKKIISASEERVTPREEHYLNCSPWQILSWSEEVKWKKAIAVENFSRQAKIELPSDLQIVADKENQYHYRNKIEYNFVYKKGRLHLALFQRETNDLCPIDECCLAQNELNKVARSILEWLNSRADNEKFQKLVVRSDSRGRILVGLYIKGKIAKLNCPLLNKTLVGVRVFQLDDGGKWELGDYVGCSFLTESINGIELRFGVESFFQVNVPIFKLAIDDIAEFINRNDNVLDFYSGVGSISLPLAKKFRTAHLIESGEEALKFAEQNIDINRIDNCKASLMRAEEAVDLIGKGNVLILDPPRAGLEKSLIAEIIERQPKRLIYLSCDVATQARDLNILKEHYEIVFSRLYNFFPRTPHIESLIILDKVLK